jgi:hypothetical protein
MDNTTFFHTEHYGRADRTYEIWSNGPNAVHMLRKDTDVTVFPSLQNLVMYEQGADVESFPTTEARLLDLEHEIEKEQLYIYENLKQAIMGRPKQILFVDEKISFVNYDLAIVCNWLNQPEYWLKSNLHHRLTYVDVIGANEHLYSLSSDEDDSDCQEIEELIQKIREQAPDAAYFRLTS